MSDLAMMRMRKDFKNALIVVVSLATTPLLLFISTSIPIYLRNQVDLGFQVSVLSPFVGLFAGTLLAGIVLWRCAAWRAGRLFLWAYFLAGPLFLAFTLFRDFFPFMENPPAMLAFATGSIALIVAAALLGAPRQAVGYFAILGLLLLPFETYRLLTGLDRQESESAGSFLPEVPISNRDRARLPNIYHVVLDGYQSDIFTSLLTQELRQALGGFVYFPEAAAVYSHTTWSIPSVFLGAEYDFSISQSEYQDRAFNSKASVLYALKEAGYSTIAYTRQLYPIRLKLFDRTIQHAANVEGYRIDGTRAFVSAWLYRHAPSRISHWLAERDVFLGRSALERFKAGTFLPDSAPNESYLSFQRSLQAEDSLPASGRYTFLHLLLPHEPYIFDSHCDKSGEATAITQSQCAARMMVDFVNRLKALERFEESLIIIHGDHGDRFFVRNGALVAQTHRSHRTLLLVKPRSATDADEMERSPVRASLLDVAPTLREMIASTRGGAYERPSLFALGRQGADEPQRYYYLVKGEERMGKHRIENDGLRFEEDIALESIRAAPATPEPGVIPVFEPNRVIEAEAGHLTDAADVESRIPGTSGSHVSNGAKWYRFDILREGRYRLKARLVTPSGNNNSAIVRVDDEKARVWHMDKVRSWKWQESPLDWHLTSGLHVLTLEDREQFWVDQIELVELAPASTPK